MIPAVAHFIWYGRHLPWAHALAVMTAARNGGFDRVCLHHNDTPDDGPGWVAADEEPRVELVPLHPEVRLGRLPQGAALMRLYDELRTFPSRANMVRAAVLYTEGGVYLDTDTITVASVTPLRQASAFAGLEHVTLPNSVRQSRRLLPWARAGALLALRDALRRLPSGHTVFQRAARLFPLAANNAVLGAHAGHPFVGAMLASMANAPPKRRVARFALGTGLLQALIEARKGQDGLVLHPPQVFYPLGPEISEHWFRTRRSVELSEVVSASTRVIHWYASVRSKQIVPQIDAAYLKAHAETQLFSAAAQAALRQEPLRSEPRTT